MRLSRRNKDRARRPTPAAAESVRRVQTKPTKALVALVVTVAGLVGIHLTHGTAELIVGLAQLVLVVYGVWRAHNAPRLAHHSDHQPGPGVGEFL